MSFPIAVCGSMAYDTIMVFPDRFRNHILPEQIHILNVAFHVPELRREFGGCAGNIAYGLRLLGMDPIIVATMGQDAGPYLERLRQLGIRDEGIRLFAEEMTAQAYIITDLDDNQITAFHPGAMLRSHAASIEPGWGAVWGIVAPDGREGMLVHCETFHELAVPFVFDPGQGLPLLTGAELVRCLELAQVAVVNDYEAKLLEERTGLRLPQLAERVEALIVTRGGEGADLFCDGRCERIEAVPPRAVVDPTGCGDAFRAGLLCAKALGADWGDAVRLGSVMGSEKIAVSGAQNYALTFSEAVARLRTHYGVGAAWAKMP